MPTGFNSEWTDEQIEYLRENYIYHSLVELSKLMGKDRTVIRRKAVALGLIEKKTDSRMSKSKKLRVEHQFGEELCKLLHDLHWNQELSVKQMSKKLGITCQTIYTWMQECGLTWRGPSDATKNALKHMPEEKKEEIKATMSASGKIRAKKYPNPMLGRGGELHHRWRGGKEEYRKIRSASAGAWWKTRTQALERDNYTCQKCGTTRDNAIIDVHHIVEVRAGGSNLLDNLICVCRPCHQMETEKIYAPD